MERIVTNALDKVYIHTSLVLVNIYYSINNTTIVNKLYIISWNKKQVIFRKHKLINIILININLQVIKLMSAVLDSADIEAHNMAQNF